MALAAAGVDVLLAADPAQLLPARQIMAFTRLPERDWQPAPGIDLLVYALDL